MKSVRILGLVAIGSLVAVGVVRSSDGSAAAARLFAQSRLVATALAAGVDVGGGADPTPQLSLQKVLVIAPGASGEILASGVFPAGATFKLRNTSLALGKEAVAGNQYRATVSAAADALPGTGYLEVVGASGRRAGARAVVIGGKWQVDATIANGWRVRMTPFTKPLAQPDEILMKAEFFKGAETTPFEIREAKLYLPDADSRSFSIQFTDFPKDDGGCAAATMQMSTIVQRMSSAKTQAEQDRVSNDLERIQAKMSTCLEKQMKDMEALVARSQDPAYQQAERDKEANFGCRNLTFQVGAGNAFEGNLVCGTNVHEPKATGTLKFVGA